MGATASCTKDSLTSFGPSDLNININRIHPQEGGVEGLADWVGDSRVLFPKLLPIPSERGEASPNIPANDVDAIVAAIKPFEDNRC